MAEKGIEELIKDVESGKLDAVIEAGLNEAKKYKKIDLNIGDFRRGIVQDLREKQAKQTQDQV